MFACLLQIITERFAAGTCWFQVCVCGSELQRHSRKRHRWHHTSPVRTIHKHSLSPWCVSVWVHCAAEWSQCTFSCEILSGNIPRSCDEQAWHDMRKALKLNQQVLISQEHQWLTAAVSIRGLGRSVLQTVQDLSFAHVAVSHQEELQEIVVAFHRAALTAHPHIWAHWGLTTPLQRPPVGGHKHKDSGPVVRLCALLLPYWAEVQNGGQAALCLSSTDRL